MSSTWFAKGKMGLDGNRPIDVVSGAIAPQMADPSIVADTSAAFVRINFVLGPWTSPQDTTVRAGRTWFQTYDTIVDGFLSRGVDVYGLIGAESTSRPDPVDRFRTPGLNQDAEQWLQEYGTNFRTIAAHFAGRVKIYESFNEPNDWHGGSSNWVHPYWFARMLKVVYQQVKIDAGLGVTLVSGPLLTHDLPTGGDDGTYYLDQTYRQGHMYHSWNSFQATHGTYPLDGIGYHLYVAEQQSATANDIEAIYNRYLSAIWQTVTRYEGDLTEKGLHVSEYGWSSDFGEDKQARNMQTGLALLRAKSTVKTASWFCLQDFPGKAYGLYRTSGLTPGDRKQAYNTFRTLLAASAVTSRVGYDAQGRRYAAIIAAYERNGGQAVVGLPFDNGGGEWVHPWGDGVVQDFRTTAGEDTIIMQKNGASLAYFIRGIVRHRYIYTYGGGLGPLGYPVADLSLDEWGLPRGAFEKGAISCRTYTEFHD